MKNDKRLKNQIKERKMITPSVTLGFVDQSMVANCWKPDDWAPLTGL